MQLATTATWISRELLSTFNFSKTTSVSDEFCWRCSWVFFYNLISTLEVVNKMLSWLRAIIDKSMRIMNGHLVSLHSLSLTLHSCYPFSGWKRGDFVLFCLTNQWHVTYRPTDIIFSWRESCGSTSQEQLTLRCFTAVERPANLRAVISVNGPMQLCQSHPRLLPFLALFFMDVAT